jgi:hypothetical protein
MVRSETAERSAESACDPPNRARAALNLAHGEQFGPSPQYGGDPIMVRIGQQRLRRDV